MADRADQAVSLYNRFIKLGDREFIIWCLVTTIALFMLDREPPLLPSGASENERIWAGLLFYAYQVSGFGIWAAVSGWWCSRRMKLKEIEAAQPKTTATLSTTATT